MAKPDTRDVKKSTEDDGDEKSEAKSGGVTLYHPQLRDVKAHSSEGSYYVDKHGKVDGLDADHARLLLTAGFHIFEKHHHPPKKASEPRAKDGLPPLPPDVAAKLDEAYGSDFKAQATVDSGVDPTAFGRTTDTNPAPLTQPKLSAQDQSKVTAADYGFPEKSEPEKESGKHDKHKHNR